MRADRGVGEAAGRRPTQGDRRPDFAADDPAALDDVGAILSNVKANSEKFRSQVLDALAGLDDPASRRSF